jgi:hypothetical protein
MLKRGKRMYNKWTKRAGYPWRQVKTVVVTKEKALQWLKEKQEERAFKGYWCKDTLFAISLAI